MKKFLNKNLPSFSVVIPARYASTRLPAKPLLDIAGKPMIIWVIERAKQSGAKEVIVATDDQRIFDVVTQFQHQVIMTRSDHMSGTDRIAEVVNALTWDDNQIVVNVQGDEPLIDPTLISSVAIQLAQDLEADMATACHPIHQWEDFNNPNIVKVILNKKNHALYFSRAPIPYPRELIGKQNTAAANLNAYRHIGLYAYRTQFLKQYANICPAKIEKVESLEQLRVLYEGRNISVAVWKGSPAPGVDTKEDLEKVRTLMREASQH